MPLWSRRRFTVAAALAAAATSPASQPEEEQAAFRTTTNLVLLEVSVLDVNGVPVAGLEKNDFKIEESGRPRQISHFATGAEQVCIGLMVDFSRSMKAQQDVVASAVAHFSNQLQPADELFLVLFNESILYESSPKPLTELTPAEVSRVVSGTKADGQTALYDALIESSRAEHFGSNSRRVLVVLSDGADTASKASFDDALNAIQSSNMLIYTVGIPAPGPPSGAPGVIKRLAETTGGFSVFDPDPASLGPFFERVVTDLRARYVLGFLASEPPAGKTETRRLKVKVMKPAVRKFKIRTREQYRIQAAGV